MQNQEKEPGDTLPPEPDEAAIREHAYQLWLGDGQVHGRDLDHWLTARQMLLQQRRSSGPPPRYGGPDGRAPSVPLGRSPDQRLLITASGAVQRLRARHQPPGRPGKPHRPAAAARS